MEAHRHLKVEPTGPDMAHPDQDDLAPLQIAASSCSASVRTSRFIGFFARQGIMNQSKATDSSERLFSAALKMDTAAHDLGSPVMESQFRKTSSDFITRQEHNLRPDSVLADVSGIEVARKLINMLPAWLSSLHSLPGRREL